MRFVSPNGSAKAFDEPWRPALDKLPKPLADKLRERDRIKAQRSAARVRVRELDTDEMATTARRADDEAGAKAARAGKPIPVPAAVPKLEADRADAARALAAQEAAFITVDSEVESVASELWWANVEALAVDRAATRADIATRAAALADAVDAAMDKFAVADWQHTGRYDRSAMTWPTEVLDLGGYGLGNHNTTPVNVRDVIIAAATTCLDDPNQEN